MTQREAFLRGGVRTGENVLNVERVRRYVQDGTEEMNRPGICEGSCLRGDGAMNRRTKYPP